MNDSGGYNRSGNGKIALWVKAIAIPALLILAFLLGMMVLGPMFKSRNNTNSEVVSNDIPQSPPPTARPEPKKTEPKVDVQITETPAQTADQSANGQNGVKQDDNGLTITMDPNSGQKPSDAGSTDAAVQDDNAQQKPAEQPKKPASSDGYSTTVEKSRAAVSEPAAKGTYRVQAGTYASKDSADSLVSDLSSRGYRADIRTVQMEDRTLYRVQVGEYKSRNSADQMAERLKADGYSPTVTVVK